MIRKVRDEQAGKRPESSINKSHTENYNKNIEVSYLDHYAWSKKSYVFNPKTTMPTVK